MSDGAPEAEESASMPSSPEADAGTDTGAGQHSAVNAATAASSVAASPKPSLAPLAPLSRGGAAPRGLTPLSPLKSLAPLTPLKSPTAPPPATFSKTPLLSPSASALALTTESVVSEAPPALTLSPLQQPNRKSTANEHARTNAPDADSGRDGVNTSVEMEQNSHRSPLVADAPVPVAAPAVLSEDEKPEVDVEDSPRAPAVTRTHATDAPAPSANTTAAVQEEKEAHHPAPVSAATRDEQDSSPAPTASSARGGTADKASSSSSTTNGRAADDDTEQSASPPDSSLRASADEASARAVPAAAASSSTNSAPEPASVVVPSAAPSDDDPFAESGESSQRATPGPVPVHTSTSAPRKQEETPEEDDPFAVHEAASNQQGVKAPVAINGSTRSRTPSPAARKGNSAQANAAHSAASNSAASAGSASSSRRTSPRPSPRPSQASLAPSSSSSSLAPAAPAPTSATPRSAVARQSSPSLRTRRTDGGPVHHGSPPSRAVHDRHLVAPPADPKPAVLSPRRSSREMQELLAARERHLEAAADPTVRHRDERAYRDPSTRDLHPGHRQIGERPRSARLAPLSTHPTAVHPHRGSTSSAMPHAVVPVRHRSATARGPGPSTTSSAHQSWEDELEAELDSHRDMQQRRDPVPPRSARSHTSGVSLPPMGGGSRESPRLPPLSGHQMQQQQARPLSARGGMPSAPTHLAITTSSSVDLSGFGGALPSPSPSPPSAMLRSPSPDSDAEFSFSPVARGVGGRRGGGRGGAEVAIVHGGYAAKPATPSSAFSMTAAQQSPAATPHSVGTPSSTSVAPSASSLVSIPPLRLHAPSKLNLSPPFQEAQAGEATLTVFTGTWNLHAKPYPRELLSLFIPPNKFDLYVLGTEECEKSIEASMIFSSKAKWTSAIREVLGEGYREVAQQTLQAMHIVAFIRDELFPQVHHIEHAYVATGLGDVVGNKGGVGLAFDIGRTSFLFLNAHLAAHQHAVQQRHADIAKIFSKMPLLQGRRGRRASLPASDPAQPQAQAQAHAASEPSAKAAPSSLVTDRADRVWLMGDLNYRVHGNRRLVDALLAKGMLEVLLANDQLNQARAAAGRGAEAGEVSELRGFVEGEIKFRPTYKYDAGTDTYDTSKKRRIPSYTDRILWKASPSIALLEYGCTDAIKTSDHRPVYATFKVNVRRRPKTDMATLTKFVMGTSNGSKACTIQ